MKWVMLALKVGMVCGLFAQKCVKSPPLRECRTGFVSMYSTGGDYELKSLVEYIQRDISCVSCSAILLKVNYVINNRLIALAVEDFFFEKWTNDAILIKH